MGTRFGRRARMNAIKHDIPVKTELKRREKLTIMPDNSTKSTTNYLYRTGGPFVLICFSLDSGCKTGLWFFTFFFWQYS